MFKQKRCLMPSTIRKTSVLVLLREHLLLLLLELMLVVVVRHQEAEAQEVEVRVVVEAQEAVIVEEVHHLVAEVLLQKIVEVQELVHLHPHLLLLQNQMRKKRKRKRRKKKKNPNVRMIKMEMARSPKIKMDVIQTKTPNFRIPKVRNLARKTKKVAQNREVD